MKLLESAFLKPTLVESDITKLPKGVLRRITYPICNIGVKNHNGRKYEAKVWDNVEQDKDIVEKIAHRTLYGQAEHPKDETQSNLEKTSHIVTKLYRANDLHEGKQIQKEFAVVDLLNTPYGQIINALFEAGCDVGVSTRADGDVEEAIDESGEPYKNVIADSYKFRALDFTADPSTFAPYAVKMESNIVHAVQAGVGEKKMSKEYGLAMLESFNGTEAKEVKRRISGCDGECAGRCNMVLNGVCVCSEAKSESKEQVADYFSQPDNERYFRNEVDRVGNNPLEGQYHDLAASMVNYAKKHGKELVEKDVYAAIPGLLSKCGLSMDEGKVNEGGRLTVSDINAAMQELYPDKDYHMLSSTEKDNIAIKAHEIAAKRVGKSEGKVNEMYEVPADKRQEALSKLRNALRSNSVVGTPAAKIINQIIRNVEKDNFVSLLDIDTFTHHTGIKADQLKRLGYKANESVAPDIKLQDELANAKKDKKDFVVKFYPSNEIKSFKNEKELIPEVAAYDGNVLVMAISDKGDMPVYYGDAKLFHIKKNEDVKEKRILESDYRDKSDEDIEAEFADFKIQSIKVNHAPDEDGTTSGFIVLEFPNAGDSVAGGQEGPAEVSDSWILYGHNNKIAFDNWYPEKTYIQLVNAIRDELDKKMYRIDELPEPVRIMAIDYYQDDIIGEESDYKSKQEYEDAATDDNIIKLMNQDKWLFNYKGELVTVRGMSANESLTEKIVKVGDKWQVQSHGGKNMGEYATEAEALKRLKQVEFFKHQKESIDDDVRNVLFILKEVFGDKEIKTRKTANGWEVYVHGQPADDEALRVAKSKLDPYLKNIKNVSVGGKQTEDGKSSFLMVTLAESWDVQETFDLSDMGAAVNEQQQGRTYTKVGEGQGYSKGDIDKAIAAVKWEPFRTEGLPFMQGEAIKGVVKATGIPVRTPKGLGIKRMALHGGITSQKQKEEGEGQSGFYALDVQYSNGMAQIYIADDGVQTAVVASDFQPGAEFEQPIEQSAPAKTEAKASVTKADFVEYLNEVGIPDDDKKSNGGRIPDNAEYGEWLRRNDPIAFNVGWNDYSREHNEAKIHTVGMKVMVSKDGTNSMPAEIVETSSRTGEKATHGHYWKDHNAYLVKYANETTEYVPADMVKIIEAEQTSNPSTVEAGNLLVANKDMVAEQLEDWAETFGAGEMPGDDDSEDDEKLSDETGDKIWGLAQKLKQGKKLNAKNIAFMVFHLRQAFYDPSDMNDKLDNDKDREAMKAILATDVGPLKEGRKFDLSSGHLGNGITVWNRAKEAHGDYEKIAHIDADRKIKWYLKNPPADVVKYVEDIAKGENPSISATQPDQKVFRENKVLHAKPKPVKEDTKDIGSGKLPNKYYVSGFSDFLVEVESSDLGRSFDWASESDFMGKDWGKVSKDFGSFDTYAEAQHKVDKVVQSEIGSEPSPDSINTITIEDHISGELYSGGIEARKNDEPYTYKFYSHSDTRFTEEALAKKGIIFESRRIKENKTAHKPEPVAMGISEAVSFTKDDMKALYALLYKLENHFENYAEKTGDRKLEGVVTQIIQILSAVGVRESKVAHKPEPATMGIKESVINEISFESYLAQFERMFSAASTDIKKKFIERIGKGIVVPVNSLTEAKTTSVTLQEMVKVKEQRHIKAIADLNKVHAAEVKTLSESVSLAKQKITQLIEKQKKDLIEKYVTLTVGHSGLKLNENALTLLKQCVSEAEVDEMLGNMHRALSENALHFKADSLMIDEHIPVDPEVARVVRSVTKAFEGINKK